MLSQQPNRSHSTVLAALFRLGRGNKVETRQSPAEGMILSVQIAIISRTLNSYIEKKPDQLILL